MSKPSPIHSDPNYRSAFQIMSGERGNGQAVSMDAEPFEWDAGDDTEPIPPREWLLGNSFCRKFISSLLAEGGVGKTALRLAQMISLATGRALTGEHVFQRCRVLIVSLEDDADELRRRVEAVLRHYGISRQEVRGWLYLSAPGGRFGRLMVEQDGTAVRSVLADTIEAVIVKRNIDIVCLDPFIKAHGVNENANTLIDMVMQLLADLVTKHNIAGDAPHHMSKGSGDPGNANRGRGATAMKDAARLVYTLTRMSPEEAATLNIKDDERRFLVRMDSGKVNITPPLATAKWFRLVGVELGNATELYPHGDNVQTVEPWTPPDAFDRLTHDKIAAIMATLDAGLPDGNFFTHMMNAGDREAWRVVITHAPHKTEAEARQVIKTWVKTGVLEPFEYENPKTRKNVKGLKVNPEKRPTRDCAN
jgi:hypothetical protein